MLGCSRSVVPTHVHYLLGNRLFTQLPSHAVTLPVGPSPMHHATSRSDDFTQFIHFCLLPSWCASRLGRGLWMFWECVCVWHISPPSLEPREHPTF